jgi:hypothetical protein
MLLLKGNTLHKHLCADGLHLMQEIVQAYHPKNAPEVIAMKTEEFW